MPEDFVQIPSSELARLQAVSAELAIREQAAATQAATANARLMVSQGQTDALVQRHQAELAVARDKARQMAVTAELGKALAGQPLIDPHAAGQLQSILASELQATEGPNGYSVHSRDFRSVPDFVKQTLSHPHYSHFLSKAAPPAPAQPASPFGQPAPAAQPIQLGANGLPAGWPEPKNVGEAMALQARWDREQAKAQQSNPMLSGGSTVDARGYRVSLPSQAFGGFRSPSGLR